MRDTVSTPTSLLPPTLFPSPHSPPCIHLLSSSLFQLHTHLLSLAWISRLQPAAASPPPPGLRDTRDLPTHTATAATRQASDIDRRADTQGTQK